MIRQSPIKVNSTGKMRFMGWGKKKLTISMEAKYRAQE
jgi:hypothetical protein